MRSKDSGLEVDWTWGIRLAQVSSVHFNTIFENFQTYIVYEKLLELLGILIIFPNC
jgi:hypothetical protein